MTSVRASLATMLPVALFAAGLSLTRGAAAQNAGAPGASGGNAQAGECCVCLIVVDQEGLPHIECACQERFGGANCVIVGACCFTRGTCEEVNQ